MKGLLLALVAENTLKLELLVGENLECNEYLCHVNLQYKYYIIMGSCEDKEDLKQNLPRNSYQTLNNTGPQKKWNELYM